jgi:hypothetical protein
MPQTKPLRVVTSKRSSMPDITYIELHYGPHGIIGTLRVPNAEVSDVIQSLRFGFDDLTVREAQRVDVKREEEP